MPELLGVRRVYLYLPVRWQEEGLVPQLGTGLKNLWFDSVATEQILTMRM